MQRWCGKLRSLAVYSTRNLSSSNRLLRSTTQFQSTTPFPRVGSPIFKPIFKVQSISQPLMADSQFGSFWFPICLNQARHFSSKERKRKPVTPVTSKIKKIKMKSYSSFKLRFRTLNDGTIRRWRAGKRHNAHLKSKISKRRLRKPALVHPAYAKVMKKLNFCG